MFLVASCHRNQDKLRPDGPLGSYADFTGNLWNTHSKLPLIAFHLDEIML